MISQPHLDGLSVIRVAISGDDGVLHQLARNGARELISQGGAPDLQRATEEGGNGIKK